MTDLTTLRSKFSGLRQSAWKEMGLRALRDATRLADRNPTEVHALTAKARFYLQYAEAV